MKLTYEEIIKATEALAKLEKKPFPLRVSMEIVKLSRKLRDKMDEFASIRSSVQAKYEVKFVHQEDGSVRFESPVAGNAEKFAKEFDELLALEVEAAISKVKLPEKISATCDACKHNMEKSLEIEPEILRNLEKMVDL